MKNLILLLYMVCFFNSFSQSNEEKDIKAINTVLKKQRIAWSNYNLDGYMEAFWKSDSLKFYGTNGVTYGWENTFDLYEKAYPTKEHTGKLNYKINDISKINENAYYVLGEFHIKRDMGNANGIFMLVFKNINGMWKIIANTSI